MKAEIPIAAIYNIRFLLLPFSILVHLKNKYTNHPKNIKIKLKRSAIESVILHPLGFH